ncbi:MAG: hypothetical protein NTU53_08410 [Planctomycetota bacterium]|nr:hypothetical protein [Planctomycetota bacterium]
MKRRNKESSYQFLSEMLKGRSSFIEVLLVAVVLALGVNLIAAYLAAVLPPVSTSGHTVRTVLERFRDHVLGVGGFAVITIAVLYIFLRLFGRRQRTAQIAGFILWHRQENRVLPVERYHFAVELQEYLEAAFHENAALEHLWRKEPLQSNPPKFKCGNQPYPQSYALIREATEKFNCGNQPYPQSYALIREATEYCILEELSTHLTDYFNDDRFSKHRLRVLERNDIPAVLLSNRFMELFSRPMDDRAKFLENQQPEGPQAQMAGTEANVETEPVAVWADGLIYKRFDLTLPADATVSRLSSGEIQVKTNRFTLRFGIQFDGMSTVLPSEFLERYLQIKQECLQEILSFGVFDIQIRISVSFGHGSLIRATGWDYYRWIDSFLDCLNDKFSQEAFFTRIGWNSALTVLQCLDQSSRSTMKPSAVPKAKRTRKETG